ncbi:hypothetical protein GCM10007170_46060 [Arthrobacter liuii]|uniref:Uncharacterized protein n=1 Tax=Arthrobacter liuii TaxID=1476996 RepID=A0ABQ2B1K4_9MICC|nr:hypothetical protein GCM10007170_46060 [Arthrobacter liuii]
MAFFLEYATDHSGGWFTVDGASSSDAAAKAMAALRGLECTHAVLRQTICPRPRFGVGPVLAAFTRSTGWTMHGAWPGL